MFKFLVYLFIDVLIVVYDLRGAINLTDIDTYTTIYLNAPGSFDATLNVSISTDKRGCSNYSSISSDVNILSCLVLSCLVFNHPRSEGWSLHGQVYFTFFCLSSSSISIPVHFSLLSIHRILGFPCCLATGVVPCMISFSTHSPSFLITCPNY